MVHTAKNIPDDRRISAERAYELIDRARTEIPHAMKAGRWLLRERREGNLVARPPAG